MAKAKNVTVIPPTFNPHIRKPVNQLSRRKVAGYARVSTESDEQFTSYEAQVDYYTNYIKANPEWEFVAVYTDEGISGTNTRHRTGFKEMVSDALAGKIDLIITKSVSRFARNTVDSLTTIRKLKENGTEVYFEKEQIWTFDSKGELLLTIMSSLAQEESRSISENVTWGKRKQFSDGKYSVAYSQFLGYRKGADGQMEIDPEQAKIVKRIYRMFLEGNSPSRIAKTLTKEGIPTPAGKTVWQTRVVESILTNEKYKGDTRLQKKFTTDFLTKTMKVNEGEVPQYYVTASHPEIIDPKEWDQVNKELLRRKSTSKGRFTGSVFSGKIVCGDCGEAYGRKVWHSNDPYRKVVWQCNAKFKDKHKKCSTPHLTEEQIKDAYVTALSLLIVDREQL
jgi:DNA invertase Pin-like site-specific DNA recombinase